MKMKFKLFSIFACLVMIFGMMGCSNLIEDLKDKTQPDPVIAVTSITLDKTATVTVGSKITLTATVLPANATDKTVTWNSSDESVATVVNGEVTGVKAGSVTITATAGGKSASCTVTVKEAVYPYIIFKGNDSFSLGINTALGASKAWNGTVEYSTDKSTWTVWDGSTEIPAVAAEGSHYVYLRGKNNTYFSEGLHSTSTVLSLTGAATSVECNGNIMTLLDYESPDTAVMGENCFCMLFYSCDKLAKAPDLPATTLSPLCYFGMFYQCSSLVNAPVLPATTLSPSCYNCMFTECSSLETPPELPAKNLAENCYGYMFDFCTSLKVAPVLPATELAVGCYNAMFSHCTSLKTAPVLPAETLADKSYSFMFKYCSGLEEAPVLPAKNLAAECYKGMFFECSGLKTTPALPATELKDSCYYTMFWNCSGLTSIGKFADGNSINVPANAMEEMFNGCTSLKVKSTDASDADRFITFGTLSGNHCAGDSCPSSVYQMFSKCVIEGDFDDYNTPKTGNSYKVVSSGSDPAVTYNIDWNTTAIADLSKTPYGLATEACKIIFGKTADYSTVTADTATYTKYAIGETDDDAVYAYYKAASDDSSYDSELYVLADEDIVFAENDMIDAGGGKQAGPFMACIQAKNIVLKNVNTKAFTTLFGAFAQCLKLESIDISGLDTENVTSIEYMFTWCPSLKSVDLSMLNTSKLENMSGLFRCEGGAVLETVIFGNMDTSKVTSMDGLFYNCAALKNVDLSKFNTSSVKNFYRMFYCCESLETLDLSNFDTSSATSMNGMFMSCKNLKTLNLSSFNTEKVNTMEFMFDNCKSLQTLDLSSFNTSNVQNMYMMFDSCETLETLDLTSFDISTVADAGSMFANCTKLKTIYVAAGTDLSTRTDLQGYMMFENCTSLVGGNGTPFDPSYIDYSYARVDKAGTFGYFTAVRQVTVSTSKQYPGYGESVTLTASYTGKPEDSVTYQWYYYNSDTKALTPIEGKTSSTYTFNITFNAIYKVIVTVTGAWTGTVESDSFDQKNYS